MFNWSATDVIQPLQKFSRMRVCACGSVLNNLLRVTSVKTTTQLVSSVVARRKRNCTLRRYVPERLQRKGFNSQLHHLRNNQLNLCTFTARMGTSYTDCLIFNPFQNYQSTSIVVYIFVASILLFSFVLCIARLNHTHIVHGQILLLLTLSYSSLLMCQ